ncbi:dihydrodipicolinate synthase family protein [Phycicoccus sp. M110.8]|uniref:dihydrodipicolinate synthase family protein n=1 Tax=Phycicoccus sp. M110.8 TaxID=3075433 RepID=UPI0028FD130D|nr:dihydrodipicolinate synthase family protein [Phycicoccus sp. M110.8]MDU0313142.1 dihydrodipicolinate synthase family protein [Phycicoccus sp. M110.8]
MTTPPTFTGVVPPTVTPLTPDGAVDVPSLERLVERQLAAGVDGVFALGSSGETVFLTDEARDKVLEVTIKTVGGQVPVLAGCIEPTTPRVRARVAAAETLGADAVVVTAPFYAIVGPHEVERHLRAVGASTALPLFAYDLPQCVHTKLSVGLLTRLAAEGVLAGVKDSSGDDVAFRQLALAVREQAPAADFSLLTGHEVVVDAMMLAGASGSVPGLANVDPDGYVRLHRACVGGDWKAARNEQDRLTRLFRIVDAADPATTAGATRGVGAFKTALALLGVIESNSVSLPMRPLDEDETDRVRLGLAEAGLL